MVVATGPRGSAAVRTVLVSGTLSELTDDEWETSGLLLDVMTNLVTPRSIATAKLAVVHRSQDNRVVILEYEEHGRILSSGTPYENRLISVVTIENRKIIHWRDYMDSLAASTALNSASQ